MRDLLTVECIDKKLNERMPVSYNFFLNGGYFVMPSARMGCGGTFAVGYTDLPPYRISNFDVQVCDRLEVSINYRVFCGVEDPVLSRWGYGDFSDKGANVRFAVILPEDSGYMLPGVVIGWDDFLGTRGFEAKYLVATQVFPRYNTEISLGFGKDRLKGLFGGVLWMPFRNCGYKYLEGISLSAEYDATDYEDPVREPHPDGRVKNSPINYGLKYRLWNALDLSVAHIRGDALAASASINVNFGNSKGFVPKIDDPLLYKAPCNTEALGLLRSEEVMISDFLYAFRDQGFLLLEGHLSRPNPNCKVLRLRVYNECYATECETRIHLTHVVAHLTPEDIDKVIVVIESEGFPVQQYCFSSEHLYRYRNCCLGEYEFSVLSPLCEASCPDITCERRIFCRSRSLWNVYLRPDYSTIFGSSRGKFKYTLGLAASIDGFLPGDLYYSGCLSYHFLSDIDKVGDIDQLNPSQIVNVNSDQISYQKSAPWHLQELYLQKSWNVGCGCYCRLSGGYFQVNYGGVAAEFLCYPVCSPFAIGGEVALFKKRHYEGLGFTDKVRKLDGFTPSYHHFDFWHAMLDLYYNFRPACIDFKVSLGRFLAGDAGARVEVGRYFDSGLRLYIWSSWTNAQDVLNGQRYYDKGIGFSMPLDMFYTYSSRRRWGYSMAAWLRDIAIRPKTGRSLYPMVHELRQ